MTKSEKYELLKSMLKYEATSKDKIDDLIQWGVEEDNIAHELRLSGEEYEDLQNRYEKGELND